jgi:hypothetical protein
MRKLSIMSLAVAAIAAAPVIFVAAPVATAATVRPNANDCGLPTQAGPNSVFVGSYSNCWVCQGVATLDNQANPGTTFYCTYNPNNGLTDLHATPTF